MVIRLFFVSCVYYTLICCVWLVSAPWCDMFNLGLSFIVLPELVKHILVGGVVRRNINFNVKISNISISLTRFTNMLWRITL